MRWNTELSVTVGNARRLTFLSVDIRCFSFVRSVGGLAVVS